MHALFWIAYALSGPSKSKQPPFPQPPTNQQNVFASEDFSIQTITDEAEHGAVKLLRR